MTIDSTIAFRKLISDSLQYLWRNGDSKQDILAMIERLEKAVTKLINTEATIFLRGVQSSYDMSVIDRLNFGVLMTEGLKYMTAEGRNPRDILIVLDKIQAWVQSQIDGEVTRAIGKPKLSYQQLSKGGGLGKDKRIN